MPDYRLSRYAKSVYYGTLLCILFGCAASPDPSQQETFTTAPVEAAPPEAPVLASDSGLERLDVATVIDARPAALVNGLPVTWGELRPMLTEASGREILEELVLDRQLSRRLEETGVVISRDDAMDEQRRLLETLSEDSNTAVRLLNELRAQKGLGPTRFNASLRRNAGLRALIRDRVAVTEDEVLQLYWVMYGPRRQPRMILVDRLQQAQDVVRRLAAGEAFAQLATELSIDSSAARGGLLEPISEADPAYPQAMRRALWALEAGETSDPILLAEGYAIITLEAELPAQDRSLPDVRDRIERLVRLSEERALMDQLARSLISDASVTIFDDALQDSWTRRQGINR